MPDGHVRSSTSSCSVTMLSQDKSLSNSELFGQRETQHIIVSPAGHRVITLCISWVCALNSAAWGRALNAKCTDYLEIMLIFFCCVLIIIFKYFLNVPHFQPRQRRWWIRLSYLYERESLPGRNDWLNDSLHMNDDKLCEVFNELFKHSIKDLMNSVGCYWFFSAYVFHTDYCLFVFALFYTLLIFTPYSLKSVRLEPKQTSALLCQPFYDTFQKPDLSCVIYSHRKRAVSVTLFVASMNFTPL